MGQLEGKTALVTGGSTGIGLAAAERMAAEGAHVFITGRRKAELDAAVETIGAEAATPVVGDIAKLDDLERLYQAIGSRGQGLDVLFANASIGEFVTLEDTTEEQYDRHFDINVRGTFFTVQKALPVLNDGASIVLNSSVNADQGAPAFGLYAATKAAQRSFTRTWANELKGRGIRVNAIMPGPTETPGLNGLVPADQNTGFKQGMASSVPLGRLARPEEIAATVLFLASEQSSFMTGSALYVDGGSTQV
ncbi:SDR family NAD(P)-dependent oxidoreductase [Kineosporia babensis]|uniref:SDR family oxidoreductase n=1 Tax=Kineosporia babensis TaxID=499548 RepID=A0A9X1ST99_9ACTN|nr:SDR family oxidoreductase [Kineosporia babensis]MCD5311111.1 SDR family oxidoreductase [Kineosporia babensis]